MSRPRLLDVFCCQGGASRGYVDAGFDVVGIDIEPQPRYPFSFVQQDALTFLAEHGHEFDAIHASPPCQLYSLTHRINKSDFPDLITPTRILLEQTGLPWVIENVVEAAPEMHDPVMLCGSMFGIETYRHRLFESNMSLAVPAHPEHVARTTKMGRRPVDGEYMHIVGNFSGVDRARGVMSMPWASRDGLREAIPPAYTEHIGTQLISHIQEVNA